MPASLSWDEARRRQEILRRGISESQREWVKRCKRVVAEWQAIDRASDVEMNRVVEAPAPPPADALPGDP